MGGSAARSAYSHVPGSTSSMLMTGALSLRHIRLSFSGQVRTYLLCEQVKMENVHLGEHLSVGVKLCSVGHSSPVGGNLVFQWTSFCLDLYLDFLRGKSL